jgi:hypothetical protein
MLHAACTRNLVIKQDALAISEQWYTTRLYLITGKSSSKWLT